MKKAFIRVAIVNCALLAILAMWWFGMSVKELITTLGVTLFFSSMLNLFAGIVTSFASPASGKNHYGRSMLLFAAIAMLCSFTFCSISPLTL